MNISNFVEEGKSIITRRKQLINSLVLQDIVDELSQLSAECWDLQYDVLETHFFNPLKIRLHNNSQIGCGYVLNLSWSAINLNMGYGRRLVEDSILKKLYSCLLYTSPSPRD